MKIKKFFAIALPLVFLMTGCKNKAGVKIAVQKNVGAEGLAKAVQQYYNGKETVTEEKEVLLTTSKKYDVLIGSFKPDESLGYGMWRSKPLNRTIACAISKKEYKHSSDFSGQKIGYMKEFQYTDFLPLYSDCNYQKYDDEAVMLSDLEEGAVDAILCTSDKADEYGNKNKEFRINELLDSNIYELCVVSGDIALTESISDSISNSVADK